MRLCRVMCGYVGFTGLGYVWLCRVMYEYVGPCRVFIRVGLFIRSAMYALLACSAFKVDSGYHSKSSEPFL